MDIPAELIAQAEERARLSMLTFSGYPMPQFIGMPTYYMHVQKPNLNEAEGKVADYIMTEVMAHNLGRDGYSRYISINSIIYGKWYIRTGENGEPVYECARIGCGVKSRDTVLKALKRLEELNIVTRHTVCGACNYVLKEDDRYVKTYTQKLVNGEEREFTRLMTPTLCPQCNSKLNGLEQTWFTANIHQQAVDITPKPYRQTSKRVVNPEDLTNPDLKYVVKAYMDLTRNPFRKEWLDEANGLLAKHSSAQVVAAIKKASDLMVDKKVSDDPWKWIVTVVGNGYFGTHRRSTKKSEPKKSAPKQQQMQLDMTEIDDDYAERTGALDFEVDE